MHVEFRCISVNKLFSLQAWVGHPYYDVIDNSTDFESKIRRVIEIVCKRIGKQLGAGIDDRLKAQSKKRKFLVKSLPDSSVSKSSHLVSQ